MRPAGATDIDNLTSGRRKPDASPNCSACPIRGTPAVYNQRTYPEERTSALEA